MESELSTINRVRFVGYATYANLPITGIAVGDLGYASDRKVFYRWSGAAWHPVTVYSDSGLSGAIPNAATLPDGSLYSETDTNLLKQVQGGAWAIISSVATAYFEVLGAPSSQANNITWQDWDISAIVPAGTKAVEVEISLSYPDSGSMQGGVRNNGSALSRLITVSGGGSGSCTGTSTVVVISQIDTNRILERYSLDITKVAFQIIGYWL